MATDSNDLLASAASVMAAPGTHEVVASLIDPPAGGVVLDAGAGQGAFTKRLRDYGYRVLASGIDASQYLYQDAPYLSCDLDTCLPLHENALEGVVAIELIEHLENPFMFVREAARCLRKDGWFVVTTPNILSAASKISLALLDHPIYFGPRAYEGNGHISPISLVDIRRIAHRSGLSIEAVTYNVGKLPIPKIRHRFPLRHSTFRTKFWGESLIVKLRKTSPPRPGFVRG